MAQFPRTWTDEQLTKAVAAEHSWRGVARALGLASTSSWGIIQRRAQALGLDASHFRGKRSWGDEAVAEAVATSRTWTGVTRKLGAGRDASTIDAMKEIACRAGLDISHLAPARAPRMHTPVALPDQTFANFGREAEYLAAAWFVSRGFRVSLAGNGLPYDLVVDKCGDVQRVQVKSTTTAPLAAGTVVVKLSRLSPSRGAGTNRRVQCYAPTDFDLFFVLTGEGHVFLIPLHDVVKLKSLVVGPMSPYYVNTIGLSGRTI